ncbi:hypothetical protein Rsub_06277 [Raphidocelis subcapitata]|uniref:F-box domain-containing protein n=1 Tax=Raphidocelis subcapitata TaxID=307507 RepID=A0A2V0P8S4_9CHLO|nr:hypothetical protein Rsub_06277 [Raphidocelis subcapitata]|eukprot:GBF93557.1 hypothetical protein Rsub_06277 [Raphidocelis subcapitata]
MPPTTRATVNTAAAAAALPPDLLARICSFLPPGDAITTVPRLNKGWAAAAAPRVAELRKVARALREEALRSFWLSRREYQSFSVPLWALQEAWPQLTEQQRKLAAARAAFHGDLAALRWALLLLHRDNDGTRYCAAAAAGGQLEALQFARLLGYEWSAHTMPPTTRAADTMDVAAAALPPDLLARICSFLPPGDAITTVPRLNKGWAAAAAPRVAELRKVARALREEALRSFWLSRREHQSFSVPLWALQEAWPQLTEQQRKLAAARAAFHGDLAALRWALLLLHRDNDGTRYCAAAAAGGQLEALQFARLLGYEWSVSTCVEAAHSGHLTVLQWARAQQPPCPWNEWTCSAAAAAGHLGVLQWLRTQRPPCPWDWETCSAAAGGGHLAVLQWARAQQPPCPWDKRTCTAAARGGQLAVLQWARAQQPPCPWNAEDCFGVAADAATSEWIRAQAALEDVTQPPCPWNAEDCFGVAADAATSEWIRAQAALEDVTV